MRATGSELGPMGGRSGREGKEEDGGGGEETGREVDGVVDTGESDEEWEVLLPPGDVEADIVS